MSHPPRHNKSISPQTHTDDGGPPAYDDWTDQQLMAEAARRGVTDFERMDRLALLNALAAPDTQRAVHETDRRQQQAT